MKAFRDALSHPMLRVGLGLTGLGLCALAVTRVAFQERTAPERCPAGMVAIGERCCGAGQRVVSGRCEGVATRCAATQDPNPSGQCVARHGVISLPGGVLDLGAADWEGVSGERFSRTEVGPFRLDMTEVTYERLGANNPEPGLPAVEITATAAEAFCRSQGGRLPTSAEWVWAAAGATSRRYAWGNSGLVCRRAAFGLVKGPCSDSEQAELAGSRPDGATPEGILDLAGNVAEWTREAGDGGFSARGGSYRSRSAAELKSWATTQCCSGSAAKRDIGFRCAYDP